MTLKRCPCGKVPKDVFVQQGACSKWAYVYGDCCGEWSIEFRTGYKDIESEACKELAVDAWNEALRDSRL